MKKGGRLRSVWVVLVALGVIALACGPYQITRVDSDESQTTSDTTTTQDDSTGGQESTGPQANPPQQAASSTVVVRARANERVNIRVRPGPGCQIIGFVEDGEEINLLIRTESPTEYWYETDKLGPDELGWVYHASFTLLGDDSILPRVPETGCMFCGDGTCSPEIGEACDVCVEDCGVCPFCGDGVVNQDSEECDSGGCGTGFACQDCSCVAVVACGNGRVEAGEECDPPEPEPALPPGGGTVCWCSDRCTRSCSTGGGGTVPFCGDGICNENACSCEVDCGPC